MTEHVDLATNDAAQPAQRRNTVQRRKTVLGSAWQSFGGLPRDFQASVCAYCDDVAPSRLKTGLMEGCDDIRDTTIAPLTLVQHGSKQPPAMPAARRKAVWGLFCACRDPRPWLFPAHSGACCNQTASSSGQSPAKTGPCRSFCGAISSSLSPSTSCDGPDMTSLAPPVDITNATFGRKTRFRWSLHHCGFFTTHTLVQFWMSLFIRLKPFLLRYSRVFRVLFLSVSGYLIVMMMTLVGTNRTAY